MFSECSKHFFFFLNVSKTFFLGNAITMEAFHSTLLFGHFGKRHLIMAMNIFHSVFLHLAPQERECHLGTPLCSLLQCLYTPGRLNDVVKNNLQCSIVSPSEWHRVPHLLRLLLLEEPLTLNNYSLLKEQRLAMEISCPQWL